MLQRFNYLTIAVALATGIPSLLCSASDPEKHIHSSDYPLSLVFRGEYVKPLHRNYETWAAVNDASAGFIKKFIPEELPNLNPKTVDWARRYSQDSPRQLGLLHLNGESRQTHENPDVHERYFPGHWVYEAGCLLTADLDSKSTTLTVKNPKLFRTNGYRHGRDEPWFPHDILLVQLDIDGQHLWETAEYLQLESVNKKKRTITVKRGQYGSTARTYPKNRTYVAPIAAGIWGKRPMWFYNFSVDSPRDANGKQAVDTFADEIAEWFAPQGKLSFLDGIAFDVIHWHLRTPQWDTNNDGIADSTNAKHAEQQWRSGSLRFLKTIRKKLGDKKIITADSYMTENQRAIGVVNGIESEGLVSYNDGWRGFSKTINFYSYWRDQNLRTPQFNYIALKLRNPLDLPHAVRLNRLAIATATCLEARITSGRLPNLEYHAPEMIGGTINKPGWLGKPIGPLLHLAKQTQNILPTNHLSAIVAENCALVKDDNSFRVSVPKASAKQASVTFPPMSVSSGDVTIYCTLQALGTIPGTRPEDSVPHVVTVRAKGLPNYGESAREQAMHETLHALAGKKPNPASFYFRRVGEAKGPISVTMEFEGSGDYLITDLSIHNAPATLAREFENGAVLINPATAPSEFNLNSLFPEAKLKYLQVKDPESLRLASASRRDKLTPEMSQELKATFHGEAAPEKIKVPAIDAIFLSK